MRDFAKIYKRIRHEEELLRSGIGFDVLDIEIDFNCSEATVFRDLKFLKNEMKLDFHYDKSKKQYFLTA